ncbi:MAG: carbon storage regulator [Pirellulales bacterium]|nr:carbon storage regulator [Pirellulales bacterium]
MLVLSRKESESIEFPSLGIVVRVLGWTRKRVQLGIEAPISLKIIRSEKTAAEDSAPVAISSIAEHVIGEEFEKLESELTVLAELADPTDQRLARQVAENSIQRLSRIKRMISASLRRQDQQMAQQWREQADDPQRHEEDVVRWPNADEPPTCVRQSGSPYAVIPAPRKRNCVA